MRSEGPKNSRRQEKLMGLNLLSGHDIFLLEGHTRPSMKQANLKLFTKANGFFFLLPFYLARRLAILLPLRITPVLLENVGFVSRSQLWLTSSFNQKYLEPQLYYRSLSAERTHANSWDCPRQKLNKTHPGKVALKRNP